MTSHRVALVVGATGHVGSQLVQSLSESGDWQVLALGRRASIGAPRVRSIGVDLLKDDVAAALAAAPKPTHVFYCARAPHNESGREDVENNLAMLCRVVEAAELENPQFVHTHIVEGGKWYGAHLGPYKTPAQEDDPRHEGPNFYHSQEDWLRDRQRDKNWTWSASRPSFVCAVTPRHGRNLVSVLGTYAALCREIGAALDFPGSEASFESLNEVTEAQLFARAMTFIATSGTTANQAFNVTNGDLFRWCEVWPILARQFGLRPGNVRPMRLADWAKEKESVWRAIVARHRLVDVTLLEMANWSFADFFFGQEHDVASDVGRLRRAGFVECLDSTRMITGILDGYRRLRLLP